MGKLLRLAEIAVRKCIKHVNQLEDIGDLPYHLVKPILMKMNAKQLQVVELNSSQLLPYSDELWVELIKRDFPNRPIYNNKHRKRGNSKMTTPSPLLSPSSVSTTSPTTTPTAPSGMANKQLYLQYNQEQELFRKDSTERLKNFTKNLQRQKSENSVVEVEQILRDPVIKSSSKGPRNSILNKAKRELQNRSLMFPNKKLFSKPLINPVRNGRRMNLNNHVIPIEKPSKPLPELPNTLEARNRKLESKLGLKRRRTLPEPFMSKSARTDIKQSPKDAKAVKDPKSPKFTKDPKSPKDLKDVKGGESGEERSDVKSIKSSVFNT